MEKYTDGRRRYTTAPIIKQELKMCLLKLINPDYRLFAETTNIANLLQPVFVIHIIKTPEVSERVSTNCHELLDQLKGQKWEI